MKYFAYGSNMSEAVIKNICTDYKVLGIARLENFRLAFTRSSTKTGTGVADIVQAPEFVVWGVLYEIDEKCLFRLDRKEGYGSAYTRMLITVISSIGAFEAVTYTVMKKEDLEISPSEEYLALLIEGAKQFDLPRYYQRFLQSIIYESQNNFRRGFIVKPTRERKKVDGENIVRVSLKHVSTYKKNRYCFVEYKNRICSAQMFFDKNLEENICEMDQNLRHALRLPGRNTYGTFVNITPSNQKVSKTSLLSPRTLYLPLCRPSIYDSEKHICVLHEKNIRLLGLEEGEYVSIRSVVYTNGLIDTRTICRRVFTGSADTIIRGNKDMPYPSPREFYLDLDGRIELGIEKESNYNPAILSADISKLFISRMLYYGATLFLGLLAMPPIFEQIAILFSQPSYIGVLVGLAFAVFATIALTVLDLRARVQY